MIVKLKSAQPHDLTTGQHYVVIGIEADDYRLLNDQGSPFLYDAEFFEIVDPHEPADWISEEGEDGERYAYPPELNVVGFFEDFFDANREAVAAFWRTVNQRLVATDDWHREQISGPSILNIAPHPSGKMLAGWERSELLDEMLKR